MKTFFKETLLQASELTGRHRKKFATDRSISRRLTRLLEDLDPEGEITRVPAWQRMREALIQALKEIQT